MDKSIGMLAFVVLTLAGASDRGPLARISPFVDQPLRLKEESIVIEYAPALGEAVLLVEAESEVSLGQVEVVGPHGERVFLLEAGDRPLQGFTIETREASVQVLFQRYSRGVYDLRARTVDGRSVVGSAVLSHQLLGAPVVILPLPGSRVPANALVSWVPDPTAAQYIVTLEQGENDGLTVRLPAGTSSFQIPNGVLQPATATHVEVLVVGSDGNRTQSEVEFETL